MLPERMIWAVGPDWSVADFVTELPVASMQDPRVTIEAFRNLFAFALENGGFHEGFLLKMFQNESSEKAKLQTANMFQC